MKPEVAPPAVEVCTNFIGRGKPLPYIDSVVYLLIRCLRHHLPGHGKAAAIRRSVNGCEVKDNLYSVGKIKNKIILLFSP